MLLNNLIGIFLNLCIQYVVLIFTFHYLTRNDVNFKEIGLGVGLAFIPAVALYYFNPMISISYLLLSQLLIFFKSYKKYTVITFWGISIIIAVCADHFSSLLIMSFSPVNSLSFIYLRLIAFLFISFIFLIFVKFSVKQFKSISVYYNRKIAIITTLLLIFTVIIFYLNIDPSIDHIEKNLLEINTIIICVYAFVLVLLISVMLKININRYKLKLQQQESENFKNYVSAVEQINNDMQKFRHDYINILLSMRGYILEKDYDGLEHFFNEGIMKFENKTLLSATVLKNLNKVKDNALKGLIFNKFVFAIEQNIDISLQIADEINISNNKANNIIDLIRIIGILLDNAIENSLGNEYKIKVAFIEKNNNFFFIICNQVDTKTFEIGKVFNENYSSKGEGRGLGLTTVKQIVQNSSNLSMDYWLEDNWFNIEIFIENGK